MKDMGTKMVSMKREKDDEDDYNHAPIEAMAPDYPYGLCLHLGKQEIRKLGLTTLPAVGEEMEIHARVKVTMVSESASMERGREEAQRSATLQITDMTIV